MTKWLLITTIFGLALVAPGKPAHDETMAEMKKLRGTWRLVDEVDDGKRTPAGETKNTKLTFDIRQFPSAFRPLEWKVEVDGKGVAEGTAAINATSNPKTIDYAFTHGEGTGNSFQAIYELDGDSFRHCGVLKGTRPHEFSSKPGSGQILTVFRRDKRE
jgi:uncharacterized protein (TIGR03067 family)